MSNSNWAWYVFVALYVLVAIIFRRYVRRQGKDKMKEPEELSHVAFWAGVWWPIAVGGLLLHSLLGKKSPEPEEEK